ncbi:hypothetical protein ATO6_02860 [Oceanicola sp. 22II-s10i]|uniref:hypothetical protein n=1 Tax=Oceanicola sp. 22II-s10i TaxID=1317116 RepID=UPI000B520EE2|nr:hypothetical protein [Oceanicola sp. 22II-s10i]OWU85853.1 hypothetical protein ATO6_02860 [Oceanicola sp. 22II-s10i]
MNEILKPGAGVIFMKVGTHANEDLEDIIQRKQKEIDDEGFAMWGYGGNTCHPVTMVQPFAEEHAEAGSPIILCMEPMDSKHFAEPIRADEFSVDGLTWKPVPAGINAVGSRFALCIQKLQLADFDLPLAATEVAVGRSAGRLGSQYVRGRVDKACLNVREAEALVNNPAEEKRLKIGLTAELCDPWAVFLRSTG